MSQEEDFTVSFRLKKADASLVKHLSDRWQIDKGHLSASQVAQETVWRALQIAVRGLDDESVERIDFLSHKWGLSFEDVLKGLDVFLKKECADSESPLALKARAIMDGNDPDHYKLKLIESLHRKRGREIILEEHDNLRERDELSRKALKETVEKNRQAKPKK